MPRKPRTKKCNYPGCEKFSRPGSNSLTRCEDHHLWKMNAEARGEPYPKPEGAVVWCWPCREWFPSMLHAPVSSNR